MIRGRLEQNREKKLQPLLQEKKLIGLYREKKFEATPKKKITS